MRPLFDAILQHVPQRDDDPNAPLQMQIISLDYSSYVGKIGVGRINRGRMRPGMEIAYVRPRRPGRSWPHQPGAEVPWPGARGGG